VAQSILELVKSLTELVQLKRERDKARQDCEGTWGYYGYSIEKELEEKEDYFKKVLDNYIDERMEVKLKEIKHEL